MMSRIPPVSPASIMLVVRSSKTLGYCFMALASVAPPSTVVRTPVKVFWKAGFDHHRELAEEDGNLLGLDFARAESRQGKLLPLFPDGARRDAFAAQLAG